MGNHFTHAVHHGGRTLLLVFLHQNIVGMELLMCSFSVSQDTISVNVIGHAGQQHIFTACTAAKLLSGRGRL